MSNVPLNIAVVRVRDPHLVIQPGGGNPLAGQPLLLARHRNAHDLASSGLRGVDGEPAPPAADLQNPVARSQIQLSAHEVKLRLLGRPQVLAAVPNGAGVRQRLVQEQPEELIPEVIVRVDILLAARAGIATARVAPPVG